MNLHCTGFLLPLLLGCGGALSVTGTVTYDGKPIEDGQISFLPVDGKGTPARGPIVGGKYRVDKGLDVGPRRVESSAIARSKSIPRARKPSATDRSNTRLSAI